MHHALDLTEILLRIATYLSASEFSICATTCKPWNDLFLPLLYRAISLKWNSKISLEALEKHAHLVRDLGIAGNIPAQFYWIPYTRLTRLSFDYFYRNNRWDLCAQLIRCQQQSLEHMALAMPCKASKAVWEAIAGCSRLDSLSVKGTYLDAEHFPCFWDACSQVTQLTLQCMNMSWIRFIPPNDRSSRDTGRYILGNNSNEHAELDRLWQLDWPSLKVKQLALTMNNAGIVLGHHRKGFQFRLLEKCPDLISLDWRSFEGDTLDFDLFAQAMATTPSSSSSPTETTPFPHLSRLNCSSSAAIGDQVASIVESLVAPLQLLHVYQPNDAAGERLVRSIHSHLSSLTSVDLSYILSMDRATVQTVLTSSPLLEVLVAGAVSVQDMMQGPPWVSTRLRRLSVFFDMGGMVPENGSDIMLGQKGSEEICGSASNVSTPSQDALQSVILATSSRKRQECMRHVFRQLSVLTSLVQLQMNRNVQLQFTERGVKADQFLDFSLRGGLEMLSTLKRLEYVRLPVEKPVCQCYGVEDVEWMLRAWPRLRGIDGELHPSPVVYDELKQMFESGGVLVVK
ncbi:hypothetical protein BGZ74_003006 [Mortierella antarctica]|nr:hypothetical protein BGZ74_003006 [Mortierella antarctica]